MSFDELFKKKEKTVEELKEEIEKEKLREELDKIKKKRRETNKDKWKVTIGDGNDGAK